MLLLSAVVTPCSLVCNYHYTDEDTTLTWRQLRHRVLLSACTDVSEEHSSTIFDGYDPVYHIVGGGGVDTVQLGSWTPGLQANT
jgi:hypothetical protein